MKYSKDERIVLTLDAGGTNFDFSAIQGNREIIETINIPVKNNELADILKIIIDGFKIARSKVRYNPVAISFCFPGPADYKNGIIGDLQNLPAFRNGVPLKPMLEEIFDIPVFINNDGDLFAYGEAIAGLLPEINKKLEEAGNNKRYRNLLGVTFGTGFGGGIVTNGELFVGDNSAGAEINRMRNYIYKQTSAEDSISIRAIKRSYSQAAGLRTEECPDPKEIYNIGSGKKEGNKEAAIEAFEEFALAAGDILANAITLFDGLIVIGGGLAGANPLFIQKMVDDMNREYTTLDNEKLPRLEIKVYNIEDDYELSKFITDTSTEIEVPYTGKKVNYNPEKKTGVGISRLGTSKAVGIGAYAFALNELDR